MPPGVHIWFKYENRDNPEKEVYLDEASIRKKIRGYVSIIRVYLYVKNWGNIQVYGLLKCGLTDWSISAIA